MTAKTIQQIQSQGNFTRTGCIVCDQEGLSYCLHKGPDKGGAPGSEGGESHVVIGSSKGIDDAKDMYAHLQPGLTMLTLKPGYTVGRVTRELEKFIKELAAQQGIDTTKLSVTDLAQQLGIQYHTTVDSLVVSMKNPNHYYSFLKRIGGYGMVDLPNQLQKEISKNQDLQKLSQAQQDQNLLTGNSSLNLTPLSTKLTPDKYKKDQ